MRFHLPSFLLGCVAGAGAKTLAPRLRPLLMELATAGFRAMEGLRAHLVRKREDVEDLLAEARAHARGEPAAPSRN